MSTIVQQEVLRVAMSGAVQTKLLPLTEACFRHVGEIMMQSQIEAMNKQMQVQLEAAQQDGGFDSPEALRTALLGSEGSDSVHG